MNAKETMDALKYLAGCCDGAATKDGQGFNKTDSSFGKDLAIKASTIGLTQKQLTAAQKMLRKYSSQLSAAGFKL